MTFRKTILPPYMLPVFLGAFVSASENWQILSGVIDKMRLSRAFFWCLKNVKLLISASLICSSLPIASAEEGEAQRDNLIAIVDIQRVVNESIIGKAARSNVEAQIKKSKAKLSNLQSDLEKAQAELQKQASVLSASALDERREGLRRKQLDVQRAYQDIQEQLAKLNEREIKKVVDEANKLVDALAQERDYTFVFERDRRSVVYASPRIDITEEVIKALDKRKIDL
jgi:outer membrane protein